MIILDQATLRDRYEKLLNAGKLAFGALVGAHAADDSVQGRARRVLRGVLVECGMFDGNCPDLSATMETVLDETAKTERKECAAVARNFWPAVDGSLPEHYAKVVREVRECIGNEIMARGNPPSQPERDASIEAELREPTPQERVLNTIPSLQNVKTPECIHCDDRRFVAGNNDDLVHGRRQKPCPVCNPSGTRPEPKDNAPAKPEMCPDCQRPKAKNIGDVLIGRCPKWYAIRDPEAVADCRQHAPAESPPEVCCVCGVQTGLCCHLCKDTVVPLCANCKCPKVHTVSEPWQKRVMDEKHELGARLAKLRDFMNTPAYGQLEEAERGRLARQLVLMDGYHEVLDERVKAFFRKKPEPDPIELPRAIEALLRIGSQHPTYGQPGDRLVLFANRILAEARDAVHAVGNDDDAKADWCEAVAAHPEYFGTGMNSYQIHATRLTNIAEANGWSVSDVGILCEIDRDRLGNGGLYEIIKIAVEEGDDMDWIEEQFKAKPKSGDQTKRSG